MVLNEKLEPGLASLLHVVRGVRYCSSLSVFTKSISALICTVFIPIHFSCPSEVIRFPVADTILGFYFVVIAPVLCFLCEARIKVIAMIIKQTKETKDNKTNKIKQNKQNETNKTKNP